MENFFLYISKPVDDEEFSFWVDSNNICYLKMELFQDFVISLVNLVYKTYLGHETTIETNIPVIWKRSIEIKAWTSHWTIIKIPWDGVKHIDSDEKWDLFVNISLKIPKKLGKTEREHYEEIAKEKKINVNKAWVFEKIFG